MRAFFPKFLKKKYIIALDIGTASIKLAQFIKQDDGLSLIKVKFIEITKDKDTLLSLKEICRGVDLKGSLVITLVNSREAMVKRIVAPQMPESELKSALYLEAKNYFPVSIVDSTLDFEIVGNVLEKGIKKAELLAAVCPNALIREHLHLLSQAGIKPEGVIHPGLALYALLRLKKLKEARNIAALTIGKTFSELIIVKDERLALNRKLPVSGEDFTKAAMSPLSSAAGRTQLSYEEAEKIKREYGIPHELNSQLLENKITTAQLFSLFRPVAEKLAQEIERSFDYYREEAQGERVDKLILFGGSAQLKGLAQFLSGELGIEVEIYNALEGVDLKEGAIDKTIVLGRIAEAVGAGITNLRGINLLPLEMKEEAKNLAKRAVLKAAVSAGLTLMILVFIGMRLQSAILNKAIKSAEFEIEALAKQFGSPGDWVLINQILINEPYCEDLLKEISFCIPSAIRLKEMNLGSGLLTLKGIILSSDKSEKALSDFIHSLERGIFKNVRFVKIEDRESVKEFQLQMETE
jgi:type IV pilus assembly protein PilM